MTALVVSAVLAVSTAYCDTGTMADGSYTRAGSVASNRYPLGTRLRIWPSPTGRRLFVVRDRIGWGSELDFYLPSCRAAIRWGRRIVHVRRR
jgi:3D (Asp-Asp-Asp) domain-containing protein